MHKQYPILSKFDLHLFDGAAGGAAGASGAAPAGGEGTSAKAETNSGTGSSRQSKTGAPIVVYGKQSTASNATETNPNPDAGGSAQAESEKTPEEKAAAFREMIKGEFKDQFTQEAQGIINRRFKESKGMEATIAAQKPVMDMLMQRYNIEDGDPAKLLTALEQDNSYWEAAAEQAGMTVEQFKANQQMKREIAEFRKYQERQQNQQQAQQQVTAWMQEAEALKKDFYPEFNLQTELANKQFLDLLKLKLPMKQAYELVHMEEIKTAEAKKAADTASQQMQANIRAKASRPSENGTSKQSAVITKSDVHSLTREDRAAAAKEAMKGKKISW